MKSAGRRWGWTFAVICLILCCAVIAVALRHNHPKLITSEDIAIFASAFTLSTAALSFAAARESRAAASDSRRALQLHFTPSDVRVAFVIRDPNDPQAQMQYTPLSDPAYLWVSLLFWGEPQDVYTLVWIDDAGQSRNYRLTPTPGSEHHVRLVGIVGREESDAEGRWQVKAGDVHLELICRDRAIGSSWLFAETWRAGTSLGSERASFRPAD